VNQTGDKLSVGEFSIIANGGKWNVQKNDQWIKTFDNKIVAYYFAYYYPAPVQKIKYLESIDKKLSNTKQDKNFHFSRIRYYSKTDEYEMLELHENRFSECKARISQCIDSISKYSKSNF